VTNRSELLSLLTEACELEHALSCTYLFAAFTLKQDASEGELSWRELQRARRWAGQVYFIASQEMLHMAQVWNLLTAIGGTPYYARPAFPQSPKYFALNLPLRLLPFGAEALDLFVAFESPVTLVDPRPAVGSAAEPGQYRTVGELYGLIRAAFAAVSEPEIFIGPDALQADEQLADFPDLLPVHDIDSALAAIDCITEQGEGTSTAREDCHFGMFTKIRSEFHSLGGDAHRVVRDCARDPVTRQRTSSRELAGRVLTDPYTRAVADLFDSLYGLMLRLLAFGFGSPLASNALRREMCRTAIELMPTALQPLGEALALLPASPRDRRASGPTFGMARHIPLPVQPELAVRLVNERFHELASTLTPLAHHERAPRQLQSAARALNELARLFAVTYQCLGRNS